MSSTSASASARLRHQNQAVAVKPAIREEIARAAFILYERNGSRDGYALRNWLDAEAQVQAGHADGRYGRQASTSCPDHAAIG
jgi:hypothetical protein